MEALLEKLIESPKLELYVRELQATLDAERLKREEFLERLTEDGKAEFINGETIVHSPVRNAHSEASDNLFVLIKTWCGISQAGRAAHEKLMVSLTRNDYEPDICFWRTEKAAAFTPGQLRFPAPDFIAEVLSESTEKADRGVKFEDYAAHGVAEYWIVDPESQTVEQYDLKDGRYELRLKMNAGTLKSIAIPGFEIPTRAIFDAAENAAALRAMIAARRREPTTNA